MCSQAFPAATIRCKFTAAELVRQLVLDNQVMLGSVNAARGHFQMAVDDLAQAQLRWGAHIALDHESLSVQPVRGIGEPSSARGHQGSHRMGIRDLATKSFKQTLVHLRSLLVNSRSPEHVENSTVFPSSDGGK